jgi:hypothetical protein
VDGVSDVRQRKRHTAEPLVREQSAFYFEMVIEKLTSRKLLDMDQIPGELIKAEIIKILSEFHKLINYIW